MSANNKSDFDGKGWANVIQNEQIKDSLRATELESIKQTRIQQEQLEHQQQQTERYMLKRQRNKDRRN